MKKYIVIERREELDKHGFTYWIKEFDALNQAYAYWLDDMTKRQLAKPIEVKLIENND